jgi:hypothetical protein
MTTLASEGGWESARCTDHDFVGLSAGFAAPVWREPRKMDARDRHFRNGHNAWLVFRDHSEGSDHCWQIFGPRR